MERKIKLTKAQRHEIYKEAKERIESEKSLFICLALDIAGFNSGIKKRFDEKYDLGKTFPEFWKQKPEEVEDNDPWFDSGDINSRIKVLDKCIKETE